MPQFEIYDEVQLRSGSSVMIVVALRPDDMVTTRWVAGDGVLVYGTFRSDELMKAILP